MLEKPLHHTRERTLRPMLQRPGVMRHPRANRDSCRRETSRKHLRKRLEQDNLHREEAIMENLPSIGVARYIHAATRMNHSDLWRTCESVARGRRELERPH